MHQDIERVGTVKWVASLGFSQGTIVAASLVCRQQLREEAKEEHHVRSDFRFGIFIAGRVPLVSLEFTSNFTPVLSSAAGIPDPPDLKKRRYDGRHVMRISTPDVHGSLTVILSSENSKISFKLVNLFLKTGRAQH
jgi:hypothetical protein